MSYPPKHRSHPSSAKKGSAPKPSSGRVRVIAGDFRGRTIEVPVVDGLRPTGDRTRETLFNWLQVPVIGAHCLDLFAGSGALGVEALSRRAASVVFVEPHVVARQAIIDTCESVGLPVAKALADADCALSDSGAIVFAGKAEQWLEFHDQGSTGRRYDIIFIDPPFRLNTQWQILAALGPQILNSHALVYIESPTSQSMPESLPPGFVLTKEKQFGDVCARLLRYSME